MHQITLNFEKNRGNTQNPHPLVPWEERRKIREGGEREKREGMEGREGMVGERNG